MFGNGIELKFFFYGCFLTKGSHILPQYLFGCSLVLYLFSLLNFGSNGQSVKKCETKQIQDQRAAVWKRYSLEVQFPL